jgi:hypothetical protein
LARTNYKFEKRQRELKKQKKKAEKLARKFQKQNPSPDEDGGGESPTADDFSPPKD